MFQRHLKKDGFELAEKPPLEMVARFLAAQAWSREICQPVTGPDRARKALEVSEYVNAHWREFTGPAALLVRTCFKRPSRAVLNNVCSATGAPENVVLAIWDASVESSASDTTLEPT